MLRRTRHARGVALVACVATVGWATVGCSVNHVADPTPSSTPSPSDPVSWKDGVPVVPGYDVGEIPPVPMFSFPANLNALIALGTSKIDLSSVTMAYPGVTVTAADCAQHDTQSAAGESGTITWLQGADGNLVYTSGDVSVSIGADHRSGSYVDSTRMYSNKGDGTGYYKDKSVEAGIALDGTIYSGMVNFSDGSSVYNDGEGGGSYFSKSTTAAIGRGITAGYSYAPGEHDINIYKGGKGVYEDANIQVVNKGDGTGYVKLKSTGKTYVTKVAPLPPVVPVTPLPPLDPGTSAKFCGVSLHMDAALLFDFGSAQVRPDAQAMLDVAAKALTTNHVPKAVIEGHTDGRGNATQNQTLSEQRAQAVVDILQGDGVTTSLKAKGYGSTRPVAPEVTSTGADDPAGRQLNRRVEIFIPTF